MKSITEFASFTLNQGLKAKAAAQAEGKTPEEIQTSLGETFKFEGDKLGFFMNSLEVAGQNTENLKRVLVVSLGEGEKVPAKAVKVEETYFVPDFFVEMKKAAPKVEERGGRGGKKGGPGGGKGGPGGKGGRDGGQKESPWGLSPEQKAAKNKGPAPKPVAKSN